MTVGDLDLISCSLPWHAARKTNGKSLHDLPCACWFWQQGKHW